MVIFSLYSYDEKKLGLDYYSSEPVFEFDYRLYSVNFPGDYLGTTAGYTDAISRDNANWSLLNSKPAG